jgi:CDP-diacylglycerol--glycerol-3-phosphate 3-phosphatidyltransferase
MAPVLWVAAILGNLTVVHRMIFTFQEAKRLEEAQTRVSSSENSSVAVGL